MSQLSEKMTTIEVTIPIVLMPYIDEYIQCVSEEMMESAQTINPLIGKPLLETLEDLDIEKTILGRLLAEALAFKFTTETGYDENVETWLLYALTGLDQL